MKLKNPTPHVPNLVEFALENKKKTKSVSSWTNKPVKRAKSPTRNSRFGSSLHIFTWSFNLLEGRGEFFFPFKDRYINALLYNFDRFLCVFKMINMGNWKVPVHSTDRYKNTQRFCLLETNENYQIYIHITVRLVLFASGLFVRIGKNKRWNQLCEASYSVNLGFTD